MKSGPGFITIDARGVPTDDPRGVPVDLVIVSVEPLRCRVLRPASPRMVDDSFFPSAVRREVGDSDVPRFRGPSTFTGSNSSRGEAAFGVALGEEVGELECIFDFGSGGTAVTVDPAAVLAWNNFRLSATVKVSDAADTVEEGLDGWAFVLDLSPSFR